MFVMHGFVWMNLGLVGGSWISDIGYVLHFDSRSRDTLFYVSLCDSC